MPGEAAMKVLIVDDSAVMRRIHKNVLLEHGLEEADLVETEDGQQALKAAVVQQVDLFLVDWNMPKLDGFGFVKKVRAMPQYAKTPIIMITSEAARYNVVEAIQAGVTNYVVKPIKGDVLWQKLSQYVKPGGAR
jgi:two-component system chemotaxis response regulator CheY